MATSRRLPIKLSSEQADLLRLAVDHYRRNGLPNPGTVLAYENGAAVRRDLRSIDRELDVLRLRFARLDAAEVRHPSTRCRQTTGCIHLIDHDGACVVYAD